MPNPIAISRFKMLDTCVKRCLVEAGAALEEIRDTELYLAGGHVSFKNYCESLGKNYHWAWKQMRAAKIARENPQIENVATAEAVAKVSIPQRRQVIQEALKQSEGKLTAPAIKKAVKSGQKVERRIVRDTISTGDVDKIDEIFTDKLEDAWNFD